MRFKPENKSSIVILFTLSLLVRFLALAMFPAPALDDSAQIYLKAAHLLIDGNGFSDPSFPVYNPPVYPIFIAICLSLFGDDYIYIKIVQAVVDSLTVVLIYFIVKEIFDIETGLVSAGILSLYPYSTYLAISIASEPLFTFFLTGFVLSSLHAIRSGKVSLYCACGFLLGLATLTRATTQFVPLIFMVLLLVFKKRSKEAFLCYAAFCLSVALVILPWTVRNYVVLDDFIPVATGGGIVVLMGSSEKFLTIDGKPEMLATYMPPSGKKPSENDKFFVKAGLEQHRIHLQTDTFGFVVFMAKKFVRLWYATESGYNHYIIWLSQLPIYIFALAGLVMAWMKGKSFAWILVCVLAYFVLLHWLSLPLFRYMIPTMPYVISLAAFAIITLKNEWVRGRDYLAESN